MTEITAVNEAARAQGMSYGQYVLRNEEPVPIPEPPPEEEEEEMRACAWCGTEFPVPENRGGRTRMYCSKACRQKASRDRKKPAEPRSLPEQLCPECGTSFQPRKTKGSPQKFCCTACRNRFNSREYWRKTHPKKEEEGMETGVENGPEAERPAETEHDPVNHPSYYTQGGVECKDAIRAAVTGLEGYEAFLTGNAIKYLWRWKRKNGAEDLRKAGFWIRELIRELEERDGGTE